MEQKRYAYRYKDIYMYQILYTVVPLLVATLYKGHPP